MEERGAEEPAAGSPVGAGIGAGPPADNAEDAHFDRMLAAEAAPGTRAQYGPRPDQFVEWFGDPHTADTVVALIHGGYFREQYTLSYLRPMAEALVEQGAGVSGHVAVALVEYRRVGGEGGHPHTLEDVEAAMATVYDTATGEGSRGVELVVAGHSAGGSLALSWASRQPEDGPAVRVRPLAAVTDLVAEVRDHLGEGAVLEYMGVRPEADPGRYLEEDPRSRAALIPARMDVQLVHGTEDRTVSIGFPRGFPATVWELDGADHFDLVDPEGRCFDEVVQLLVG